MRLPQFAGLCPSPVIRFYLHKNSWIHAFKVRAQRIEELVKGLYVRAMNKYGRQIGP
jgi:hypothetical protein